MQMCFHLSNSGGYGSGAYGGGNMIFFIVFAISI